MWLYNDCTALNEQPDSCLLSPGVIDRWPVRWVGSSLDWVSEEPLCLRMCFPHNSSLSHRVFRGFVEGTITTLIRHLRCLSCWVTCHLIQQCSMDALIKAFLKQPGEGVVHPPSNPQVNDRTKGNIFSIYMFMQDYSKIILRIKWYNNKRQLISLK